MGKLGLLLFLLSVFTSFQHHVSAQNVGIGTAIPAYKLDVGGRIRVKTGTLGNASTSSGIWMEDYRTGTNRMFFGMQDSIRGGFYGSGPGGVGWAFNFNNTTGDVAITDGSLGIGTISPVYDLYINRSQPTIGFYDSGKNHFAGTLQGDSTQLLLNAYRKNSLGSNEPGNLILQVNSGGFPNFLAGNVGIGLLLPEEKLHINGNLKLQGTTTQMILSSATGEKGIVSLSGNDIKIGTAAANTTGKLVIRTNNVDQISVTSTGEMNRLSQTGTADILPIAYARVNSSGTMLSGAGIQSVTKVNDGNFNIRIIGETISANPNAYTVIVTPVVSDSDDFTYPSIRVRFNGDDLNVELGKFKVSYTNHGDCGCPQDELNSYIATQAYISSNTGFSLVVYKQ